MVCHLIFWVTKQQFFRFKWQIKCQTNNTLLCVWVIRVIKNSSELGSPRFEFYAPSATLILLAVVTVWVCLEKLKKKNKKKKKKKVVLFINSALLTKGPFIENLSFIVRLVWGLFYFFGRSIIWHIKFKFQYGMAPHGSKWGLKP